MYDNKKNSRGGLNGGSGVGECCCVNRGSSYLEKKKQKGDAGSGRQADQRKGATLYCTTKAFNGKKEERTEGQNHRIKRCRLR